MEVTGAAPATTTQWLSRRMETQEIEDEYSKPHGAIHLVYMMRKAKWRRWYIDCLWWDTCLAHIMLFATLFREMISLLMVHWFSFWGWDKALLLHQTFLITISGMGVGSPWLSAVDDNSGGSFRFERMVLFVNGKERRICTRMKACSPIVMLEEPCS